MDPKDIGAGIKLLATFIRNIPAFFRINCSIAGVAESRFHPADFTAIVTVVITFWIQNLRHPTRRDRCFQISALRVSH